MNNQQQAYEKLKELLNFLEQEGEKNWRRGIAAALLELTTTEGHSNPLGFENAASIYRSMTSGGSGFAEYYISPHDNPENMKKNEKLDKLREELWEIFQK